MSYDTEEWMSARELSRDAGFDLCSDADCRKSCFPRDPETRLCADCYAAKAKAALDESARDPIDLAEEAHALITEEVLADLFRAKWRRQLNKEVSRV